MMVGLAGDNMVKIYIWDIGQWLQRAGGRQEMEALAAEPGYNLYEFDIERVKRCESMKHQDSAIRSLAAGVLMQYALAKEDVPKEQRKVSYDRVKQSGSSGKPTVSAGGCFVSLSHSGDYVACAIADSALGMDIQRLEKLQSIRIVKIFSEEEKNWICSVSGAESRERFYRVWTRKESYYKLSQDSGYLQKNLLGEDKKANRIETGYKFWESILHKNTDSYRVCICCDAAESEIERRMLCGRPKNYV